MTYPEALAVTAALAVVPGALLLGAHYVWDRTRPYVHPVAVTETPMVAALRLIDRAQHLGTADHPEPGCHIRVVFEMGRGWRLEVDGRVVQYASRVSHLYEPVVRRIIAARAER